MTDGGYARPELLASTDWLAERLDHPNMVIVDCGGWALYQRAHIPGAVSSPNYDWCLKDPDNPAYVLGPERFADLVAEMGIGDDTLVIAYDDERSRSATRLWWVLNYHGHHRVKVLNGGWRKWVLEGRSVSVDPHQHERARFTPRPQPDWIVSAEEILDSLDRPGFVPLDTRSRGEYTGENLRGNRYGGHMPGAVHIEWVDNLRSGDHTFKPADQLLQMYQQAGVTKDKELIAPY